MFTLEFAAGPKLRSCNVGLRSGVRQCPRSHRVGLEQGRVRCLVQALLPVRHLGADVRDLDVHLLTSSAGECRGTPAKKNMRPSLVNLPRRHNHGIAWPCGPTESLDAMLAERSHAWRVEATLCLIGLGCTIDWLSPSRSGQIRPRAWSLDYYVTWTRL